MSWPVWHAARPIGWAYWALGILCVPLAAVSVMGGNVIGGAIALGMAVTAIGMGRTIGIRVGAVELTNSAVQQLTPLVLCSPGSVVDFIEPGEMEFDVDATSSKISPNRLVVKQVPTPGLGSAKLVFEEQVRGEVVIFDTLGQAVRSLPLDNVAEVEIQNLPAGLYVAEVRYGERVSALRLLVE